MIKLATTILGIALFGSSLSLAQTTAKKTSEIEDIELANQAILSALSVNSAPKGRTLCFDNELACLGPTPTQLALSLISARQSSDSMQALARLVRFRMEGADDETLDCEILEKGRLIERMLYRLNAQRLQQECNQEFKTFAHSHADVLQGVNVTSVCRDQDEITSRIREDIDAIRSKRMCTQK